MPWPPSLMEPCPRIRVLGLPVYVLTHLPLNVENSPLKCWLDVTLKPEVPLFWLPLLISCPRVQAARRLTLPGILENHLKELIECSTFQLHG